jgi:hypothetical protein
VAFNFKDAAKAALGDKAAQIRLAGEAQKSSDQAMAIAQSFGMKLSPVAGYLDALSKGANQKAQADTVEAARNTLPSLVGRLMPSPLAIAGGLAVLVLGYFAYKGAKGA